MSESTDDTAEAQESFPTWMPRKMEKKTRMEDGVLSLAGGPDGLVGYEAVPARSGETLA